MQGKGVVRFFLILLTLVCLYQFSLYFPTNSVESAAREYAEQKSTQDQNLTWRGHYAKYLDSLSDKKIWSLFYVKDYTYNDLKKSQLALGLDLKGGMSVLLQVDLQQFIKTLAQNNPDPAFEEALKIATDRQRTEQSNYVSLFAQAWKEKGNGKSLASLFAPNEALKNDIKFDSPDAEVVSAIRKLADQTVGETYKRIKQRIDKLGVVQPNVSLDAARDLILVELPGIDNPERARAILQGQAKLEFWDTYRISDDRIGQSLQDADTRLKALKAGVDTLKVDSAAQMQTGPLLSLLAPNPGGGSELGFAEKGSRDAVLAMLNRPEIRNLFPAEAMFRWGKDPIVDEENTSGSNGKYALYALKKQRGSDEAPLDGSVVTRASAQPDDQNKIAVSLTMNNDGAAIWAKMTQAAATNGNREIAIVLDDEVVSAPRVINPITGGQSSISGDYTLEEATDLANILEIGKLPAGTHIVQESQVGPSLGEENINKSLFTMLLAVGLLCAFMVAYYNRGGWVSVVALLANLFFILGILANLGTVLTLPGIAGIVLTLATAVDAQVVIYERIREELREGISMMQAIKVGFTRALTAIIDANVTTLLTAAVLIYFGLGPIKGFGVVLLWGIISSVFTSVLVGRMITEWWVEGGREMSYSRKWSENWLVGFHYDWIGKRKYAYMFSLAIMLIGAVSFFMRGFELGVDFRGGYSFNVQFEKPVDIEGIRGPLTTAFEGNPIIKAVNTSNTYNITTSYLIDNQGDKVMDQVISKLHEGLKAAGHDSDLAQFKKTDASGTHITSSSQVGATVADDIRNSSLLAAFWALLLIFLFLLVRFNRWQFSLGAVLALLHDVLITLTFFTLLHGIVPFSLEIDQAIIACILTVIGFSVNDTVIVYDRIREFMNTFAGQSKAEVFNRAINTTLSRTLITSGTVFLVVVLLFLFGGSAIKGFAFGMLVGILFGTYSSIFVASSLVVDFTSGDVITGKKVEAPKAAAKK
ncbi:MAG: protein translocase subunit SecD [Chitinophagales bacterium]|nr:protein translocase subunit SecD [Chitinophagales bacterium]